MKTDKKKFVLSLFTSFVIQFANNILCTFLFLSGYRNLAKRSFITCNYLITL